MTFAELPPLPVDALLKRQPTYVGPRRLRQLADYRQALLADLAQVDEDLRRLTERRMELATHLLRCRDAAEPTGYHLRKAPLPHDVDATPAGATPISGGDLRDALVLLLEAEPEKTFTLSVLHRLLLAHGLATVGRPSKAISDALRWEMEAGLVERVGHGRYRATSAG